MIDISKIGIYGFKEALRGMRNPMNSWDKSDSVVTNDLCFIGENDLKLAENLCKAGTDHRKFLRMIVVHMDINAPIYWWKEFDTYKVGTVANSCSTMHKIHAKEFVFEDFSYDYLVDEVIDIHKGEKIYPFLVLTDIIDTLNGLRIKYNETNNKKYWYQMIQLLPTSYNQLRTVMLNYEVLTNIYHSRKNHKLNEWHEFCKMIEKLPYSELITNISEKVKEEKIDK